MNLLNQLLFIYFYDLFIYSLYRHMIYLIGDLFTVMNLEKMVERAT